MTLHICREISTFVLTFVRRNCRTMTFFPQALSQIVFQCPAVSYITDNERHHGATQRHKYRPCFSTKTDRVDGNVGRHVRSCNKHDDMLCFTSHSRRHNHLQRNARQVCWTSLQLDQNLCGPRHMHYYYYYYYLLRPKAAQHNVTITKKQ